jgi:hypothetical protein
MLEEGSQDPFASSKYKRPNSQVAKSRCLKEFCSKLFRFIGFNDLFG